MKQSLEAELREIAEQILKMNSDSQVLDLHKQATILTEKLSVLKYLYEDIQDQETAVTGPKPLFEIVTESIESRNKPILESVTIQEQEPNTNLAPQMEPFALPKQYYKNDLEDIGDNYKNSPIFDAVPPPPPKDPEIIEKKSLNDKLKSGGIAIGLNDKLAFIKYLFDGDVANYDRVISLINTKTSFTEAQDFINSFVKPEYNNWINKEDYETRFIEIIESRFN